MEPVRSVAIKLVIFDNNGTALDDLALAYGSVQAIFSVLGLPCPTRDQYRNEIGADYMQFYWRHGVPKHITGDQLNVIRKLYYGMRRNTVHYRSDFGPLLKTLHQRGVDVAMCSAEIPEVLKKFLETGGLYDQFPPNAVRGGAWPTKVPTLTELVHDFGVPAECAAYVDDTDDGISAAREAGLRTIGFVHPTGYNSSTRIHGAHPDHVVTSFKELGMLLYHLK